MKILVEIEDLIHNISEAFTSVVGSYNKLANDINDMESNKSQIMKLPMMSSQDKIALLQNHINNTELLKQQLASKQMEIANYGTELVNKYQQQIKQKQAQMKGQNKK